MARTLVDDAAHAILGANAFVGLSPAQALAGLARLFEHLAEDRAALRGELEMLADDFRHIAQGDSDVAPPPGDRRFSDPAWRESPAHRVMMQSYLAICRRLYALCDEPGLDWKDQERARFALALILEALAPTNNLFANPSAMRAAKATKGKSLLRGLRNVVDDLRHNGGMPLQVDCSPFELGKNIACTQGQVVYRSEVFELIQYAPRRSRVRRRPLLVIPPQINKFYVLDLSPGRSFVEYMLDRGIQPFVISWRNPTAVERDWDLGTYVAACDDAVEVTREITGSEDVNVMSACAGGTTGAIFLGHLAAKGDPKVHSTTFMVTVLDSDARLSLGPFINETTVAAAILRSRKKGVLEARDMQRVFAWLRPNDLVWNYWVNNYLHGNQPPAFDILYWNADSTRLPAALHAEFLTVFLQNPLISKGKLDVLGTPIDLSKVTMDSYVLAGVTDHITPWQACYRTAGLLGGKSRFVLSSSGHIQSIVNPPGSRGAKYYVNRDEAPDAQAWLEDAEEHEGTWWDDWSAWILERSGPIATARKAMGSKAFPPITAAPGRYAFQR